MAESELVVVTRAKDLCAYVMVATQKSPRHFRFTFVSRLQNLVLDVIGDLYRANDVYVAHGDAAAAQKRLSFQREAMTSLKMLAYFSLLSMEQGCLLKRQYEQIARLSTDCRNLLGAWMNSDRKRFRP